MYAWKNEFQEMQFRNDGASINSIKLISFLSYCMYAMYASMMNHEIKKKIFANVGDVKTFCETNFLELGQNSQK